MEPVFADGTRSAGEDLPKHLRPMVVGKQSDATLAPSPLIRSNLGAWLSPVDTVCLE